MAQVQRPARDQLPHRHHADGQRTQQGRQRQQVVVGLGSHSVVLGYSAALLPLPALLCSLAIGVMAVWELVTRRPLDLGHGADVE
jgi:hypothetical protein